MMDIMRKKIATQKLPSRKEETHERIVEVAARATRRTGYSGTGVADIMKEAGLTHGGFYAHFDSRDALLAEAGDRAGAESVALAARVAAAAPPGLALQAMMQAYLSPEHIAAIETGCPVSALGSEMPRQARRPPSEVCDSARRFFAIEYDDRHIAHLILRGIRMKKIKPKLRYTAGSLAKRLGLLRSFAPAGLVDAGLRKDLRLV
jgi:AcrR family transcriptional regulator